MNIVFGIVGSIIFLIVFVFVAHHIVDSGFPPHEHKEWWMRATGVRIKRRAK